MPKLYSPRKLHMCDLARGVLVGLLCSGFEIIITAAVSLAGNS